MKTSKRLFTICFYFFSLIGSAQHTDELKSTINVPKDRVWYITDFGAVGDGKTLNTQAIQNTIDACHRAGGGTVRVTPGNYISGTIILKDGILLHVDANAVIMGSRNRNDYQYIRGLNAQDKPVFGEGISFLIYAERSKHVAIEGKGEINGSGDAFWEEETYIFRDDIRKRKTKEWRPRALVCFVNCQFITLRDIALNNSPCYTLWPLGCDDIIIDGISIRNPVNGPNTDGIDIDCCSRVSISNCNIEGGDDAIALKSDGEKLGEDRPCEHVVVTNCILSSPPACAIRIGYEGDSPIRNCTFSNLAIYNSHHGIDLISILPDVDFPFTILQGTRIENLQFDDIVMQDVVQPIYLWMGNEKEDIEPTVFMRNIRISNLIAKDVGDSFIGSRIDKNIENIFLTNVHLVPTRNISEDTEFYSHLWYISDNPYALYIRNVTGLYVEGLTVDLSGASGYWEHAVYCENSKNIILSKVTTNSKGAVKLISHIGATNSSLRVLDCSLEEGVKLIVADENSHVVTRGDD